MKKNTKVTAVASDSFNFVALVASMIQDPKFVAALSANGFERVVKSPKKGDVVGGYVLCERLGKHGVKVAKAKTEWVTLGPISVPDITPEEHKIRCAAYKAAIALGVGWSQANYAGYHAVAESR
ncbi:hypothetical protein UFOVP1192_21 [uncultured Caudovirales phage]|uniref:Uncharacterized protein n=1 Tax=uncultured Caudovirales phage TaxID=2100421 RepID=A0A6J5R1P4_9CAUD|nr:hypothetical protein UFOVP1192_21 [uncultured Caudovirales phage]